MCDIACGKQHAGLEAFGASVGASYMPQWHELGLYDASTVTGWAAAFDQVMSNTISAGGIVHFNLTGVDVREALHGDPKQES